VPELAKRQRLNENPEIDIPVQHNGTAYMQVSQTGTLSN